MKLLINGEWRPTRSATLEELIGELDYNSAQIATAVDGVFVSRDGRPEVPLCEGMVVDIVAPMQGG